MPPKIKRNKVGRSEVHVFPSAAIKAKALTLIPNRVKVLEIGCGEGDFGNLITVRKPRLEYLGVDVRPENVETARTRFPDLRFECADALECETTGFDVLVTFQTLEHLGESGDDADVRLLERLRQGMLIVFSVPNFRSQYHRRWFDMLGWFERYKHILWFDFMRGYCTPRNYKKGKSSFLFRGMRK